MKLMNVLHFDFITYELIMSICWYRLQSYMYCLN